MRMTALAALGLGAALVSPASAVEVAQDVTAKIVVDEVAGACVNVSAGGTYAGQFSAAGFVSAIIQDGVIVLSPIQGARPLTGSYTGRACIPGVWGAHSVSGHVVYDVQVVDVHGDFYVETLVCEFGGGTSPFTCV